MSPATVSYERTGPLGYITLDRPHVLNAMNDALVQDLKAAAAAARDDAGARVIILRGAGRAFCAGAAGFKVPRHVLFVSGYPMTASGKVQRFALCDQVLAAMQARERDEGR